MQKALVIYGSTGGNTAFLAKFVALGLKTAGYDVEVKDVRIAAVNELMKYDLVVLGSSTWDKGKVQGQLQIDMRAFNEQLLNYDFGNQAVAIFGVGHYSYTFTCNAATILEQTVLNSHGRLITETFRVVDVVDMYTEQIETWASQIRV